MIFVGELRADYFVRLELTCISGRICIALHEPSFHIDFKIANGFDWGSSSESQLRVLNPKIRVVPERFVSLCVSSSNEPNPSSSPFEFRIRRSILGPEYSYPLKRRQRLWNSPTAENELCCFWKAEKYVFMCQYLYCLALGPRKTRAAAAIKNLDTQFSLSRDCSFFRRTWIYVSLYSLKPFLPKMRFPLKQEKMYLRAKDSPILTFHFEIYTNNLFVAPSSRSTGLQLLFRRFCCCVCVQERGVYECPRSQSFMNIPLLSYEGTQATRLPMGFELTHIVKRPHWETGSTSQNQTALTAQTTEIFFTRFVRDP